jgi:hypothetical protein
VYQSRIMASPAPSSAQPRIVNISSLRCALLERTLSPDTQETDPRGVDSSGVSHQVAILEVVPGT